MYRRRLQRMAVIAVSVLALDALATIGGHLLLSPAALVPDYRQVPALLAVGLLALACVMCVCLRGRMALAGCGLMCGGVLGNTLARMRGPVLNYIPIGWVPHAARGLECDVADLALFCSIALLAILSLRIMFSPRSVIHWEILPARWQRRILDASN